MPSDDPLQHLSRAAGLGAYTFFWLDMCLGVALSGGLSLPFLARWRVGDFHQFTGVLSLGLLAAHVLVLVGLQDQAFTVPELFVPMLRQVNPLAPLLGITATYLFLLIAVASHARRVFRPRAWRLVHRLSFVGFILSLVHARLAGPDASEIWVRALYIATVVLLTGLIVTRMHLREHQPARRQSPVASEPAALSER